MLEDAEYLNRPKLSTPITPGPYIDIWRDGFLDRQDRNIMSPPPSILLIS